LKHTEPAIYGVEFVSLQRPNVIVDRLWGFGGVHGFILRLRRFN
jgi:hypothetical protein